MIEIGSTEVHALFEKSILSQQLGSCLQRWNGGGGGGGVGEAGILNYKYL